MEGLIVMGVCGLIAAAIASSKGRNVVGWFFGGFFLGLIGIVIVAVISNKKAEEEQRLHTAREQRRLREQLRQERIKTEAFRRSAAARLDAHDQHLGLDTRAAQALPLGQQPAAQLTAGTAPAGQTLWYFEVNGETQGPVNEQQIRGLLRTGRITASTLLWNEALIEWTPLSQVPTFRSATP